MDKICENCEFYSRDPETDGWGYCGWTPPESVAAFLRIPLYGLRSASVGNDHTCSCWTPDENLDERKNT